MISASRNIFAANAYSNNHVGADVSKRTEADKTKFNGTELMGKKLAVIGLGHVGSLVAEAALELGMNVNGYDPYLSTDAAWNINNHVDRSNTIKQAVKNADYVTVHVPKNDETYKLIDRNVIEAMKQNSILFNYSRLGIVDNEAALEAVLDKKLKYYVTDFGEPIIADQENVIVTPHIGGSTLEAESNGATQAANTVMRYLETGDTVQSVNLPAMKVPFEAPYRFTVIHKNVPNMVGQITTILAQLNVNIASMSNAAKKDTAYTIIDVDDLNAENSIELIQKIDQITEVYRARLIKHK